MEYFYNTIGDKKRGKEMMVDEEESLKSEVERFGTKCAPDHTPHISTKEQYSKIKDFYQNTFITTRKAEKRNVFVILNSNYYTNS